MMNHIFFTEDDDEPHSIFSEEEPRSGSTEDEPRSVTETPFLLNNSIK
ncbi:unnamed protein product, partial [Rotaria sp. Silwood2]